jgi:hypothetical protein
MGFFSREVGLAVAATAMITSPQVRQYVRQGAVYGLATLLSARDRAQLLAQRAAEGAQHMASSASEGAKQIGSSSQQHEEPAQQHEHQEEKRASG